MEKKYLKMAVPAILFLPVALFIALSLRGRVSPLMKVYAREITGFKTVQMTDAQRAQAGGSERNFLLQNLLNNQSEYPSFPLIQKPGNFLGTIPKSAAEVVGQADFAISGAGKKTFYKAQYKKGEGKKADLIAIPHLLVSDMGRIENPINWLRPNEIGYPGNYPYYFPFTLRKTPYGDIVYRVYISDENPEINKIMERYMKSKGMYLLK